MSLANNVPTEEDFQELNKIYLTLQQINKSNLIINQNCSKKKRKTIAAMPVARDLLNWTHSKGTEKINIIVKNWKQKGFQKKAAQDVLKCCIKRRFTSIKKWLSEKS